MSAAPMCREGQGQGEAEGQEVRWAQGKQDARGMARPGGQMPFSPLESLRAILQATIGDFYSGK